MKKNYISFIPVLFLLLAACKKDKPAPIENLLSSKTWELYNYQSRTYVNFSGYFEGQISFRPGGRAEYTDTSGRVYTGTWTHRYHDDTEKHSLYIKVINPVTQEEKFEYYDHIEFLDDRHFTAYVYTSFEENTFQYREKR